MPRARRDRRRCTPPGSPARRRFLRGLARSPAPPGFHVRSALNDQWLSPNCCCPRCAQRIGRRSQRQAQAPIRTNIRSQHPHVAALMIERAAEKHRHTIKVKSFRMPIWLAYHANMSDACQDRQLAPQCKREQRLERTSSSTSRGPFHPPILCWQQLRAHLSSWRTAPPAPDEHHIGPVTSGGEPDGPVCSRLIDDSQMCWPSAGDAGHWLGRIAQVANAPRNR